MYADDIVLLAESAKDLQKMLDVVTAYSKQWRFRVNPKKGKSEVMIFGKKRHSSLTLRVPTSTPTALSFISFANPLM